MHKPTSPSSTRLASRYPRIAADLRWLALSILLAVVASACGAAAPGDSPQTTESNGAQSAPSGTTVPGGDSQAALQGLNAQDVVAAQEAVLGDIYQNTLPSVVLINTARRVDQQQAPPTFPTPPEGDSFQRAGGSGFVWDNQNHIVTNHHVVADADEITVIFADGTQVRGELLGSDPDADLAVLQVNLPDGAAPATPLADSDAVQVGQLAAAIGNPFGQEFTITSGIVSAVGRTIRSGNSPFSIPEVIQTDAPINPGNSGGPLLNRHGEVIGVNTQIISRSGGSSGIGFAVPINTAKRVVPALIETGSYQYAWLGISGTNLTPEMAERMELPRSTEGALVISVNEGSPADQAGLQGGTRTETITGIEIPLGGDIIVSINDEPINEMDALITYLVNHTSPGDEVTLEVIRDGERENLEVTLGSRPE